MTSEELAKLIASAAAEKLAQEIVALDLRGISTVADFFIICSGSSEPQLRAIANSITDTLREEYNIRPSAIDGRSPSQWVVLDYGDVIVHIFLGEKREFYSLEDLWSDAPQLQLASAPVEPQE